MSDAGQMCRVLLVEDETGIGRLLERGLSAEGYEVLWVRTLAEAAEAARTSAHDLVVLDRTLPDGDGAAFCAALRRLGHSAMICMLTARDTLEDKLHGFDVGADDYLTKPFEFEELLARLAALRRRAAPARTLPMADAESRTLILGHARVKLTRREWRLMQHLLANADRPIPRAELIEAGWGAGSEVTENSIDVYIGYLRRKLARLGSDVRIETVRGVGFTLVS
ncbi:MAG TPA: response regulator transcription factor [Paracoccaceae bacterium]|nr:response regulator transcription factor [Paracoccaceae bacterium]